MLMVVHQSVMIVRHMTVNKYSKRVDEEEQEAAVDNREGSLKDNPIVFHDNLNMEMAKATR